MVMCGYVTESCTACFFSFSAFSSVSTHFLRSASDSGMEIVRRRDGAILLRSPLSLGAHSRVVGEWLLHWARTAPERTFLAERIGEGWRKVSYREAMGLVRRLGQGLLDRGVAASRPVVILSENSVDHALLALGAMHVGVPVAPVSPA